MLQNEESDGALTGPALRPLSAETINDDTDDEDRGVSASVRTRGTSLFPLVRCAARENLAPTNAHAGY